MTRAQLESLAKSDGWFCRMGSYQPKTGHLAVPSLRAWADLEGTTPEEARIAKEMAWLPSSREQEDPFHGQTLALRAKELGLEAEMRTFALTIYKQVLACIPAAPAPNNLRAGPHDFTQAARGAAAYAFRSAAKEVTICEPSHWCGITELYGVGFWPCGLLGGKTLVVF